MTADSTKAAPSTQNLKVRQNIPVSAIVSSRGPHLDTSLERHIDKGSPKVTKRGQGSLADRMAQLQTSGGFHNIAGRPAPMKKSTTDSALSQSEIETASETSDREEETETARKQ